MNIPKNEILSIIFIFIKIIMFTSKEIINTLSFFPRVVLTVLSKKMVQVSSERLEIMDYITSEGR